MANNDFRNQYPPAGDNDSAPLDGDQISNIEAVIIVLPGTNFGGIHERTLNTLEAKTHSRKHIINMGALVLPGANTNGGGLLLSHDFKLVDIHS